MSIQERRERERAHRTRSIVRAARDLAETEGWGAVTTRRLAERIEYSQPVLYSHFDNRDAIVAAVALEGFAELSAALRDSWSGSGPAGALMAVARAYTDFAAANPALYDAMFALATGLRFAHPDGTAAALQAAFGELRDTLAPIVGDRDPGTLTEVAWSALHGLVVLARDGRLREGAEQERLAVLVDLLARG